jgi:hypothetical protein
MNYFNLATRNPWFSSLFVSSNPLLRKPRSCNIFYETCKTHQKWSIVHVYVFRIKTIFSSFFPPCLQMFTLLVCLFANSGVHHILCCVFALLFFVLCTYVASLYGLSLRYSQTFMSLVWHRTAQR